MGPLKLPMIVCNGYAYRIAMPDDRYYMIPHREFDGSISRSIFETVFWWRANRRLLRLIKLQIREANRVKSILADEYYFI